MTPLELCDELYEQSAEADRCPLLIARPHLYACGSSKIPDDEVSRRMPCDHFSLQLWCLAGPTRWPICELFSTHGIRTEYRENGKDGHRFWPLDSDGRSG